MKTAATPPSRLARIYFLASAGFACASAVLLALANLQPAGAF